ncbi:MAG: 2-amino-4-hydroxy-6-hydroxymethyldihydropteridine diphosphokinase [Bacteroidetes bacterium]|nr:2-amino-4-hydroxy-6-hydroxymethyldihydropteridine diphosphokinase [Bacteroidota bacterium]
MFRINENQNCNVVVSSSVYETIPYGYKDQENFLNAVIKAETNLTLIELFDFLKFTENNLGRIKRAKWGPREIDLDLLFFNDMKFSNDKVTIPHKEIIYRDFVLVPLSEIAADFVHPTLNKKICDICLENSEKFIIQQLSDKIL